MQLRPIALAFCSVLAIGQVVADEPAKAPVNTPKIAAGLMVQQGGRMVMSPCRDRSYANVEDVSDGQKVVDALNQVGLAEGNRLYVELVGVLEGGAVRASGVNLAQVDGRCQRPGGGEESWRAVGDGWSLVASATHLRLSRAGQPELLLAANGKQDDQSAQIDAESPEHRLAVRLTHEICRDQASRTLYGWTAQVAVDGQLLRGCAWQR